MGPAKSLEVIHSNQSQKRATNPGQSLPRNPSCHQTCRQTRSSRRKVHRLSSPSKLLLHQRKVALLLLSLQQRSLCSTGTCSKSGPCYHTSSKQLTNHYYCYLWPKPRRSKNQNPFPVLFLVLFLFLCSCPSKFRKNSSVGLSFSFLSFAFS